MKKEIIPKLNFKIAKLNEIIGLINEFLNPNKDGWDWSYYIYNRYPKLEQKLKAVENIRERKKITKNFFRKLQNEKLEILRKTKNSFQKEWNKINDNVMVALSKIVEQRWPENCKTLIARVSLCPINPRYINERTFDLFYKLKMVDMKAIAIHEIFHFIYFEKWKKIFPDTPGKKFEAPYLVWDLSELITSVVLSDLRIQNVFKAKPKPYKEHLAMKINGKGILIYLKEIYNKRKSFEDFIRKSWIFVKKHKKEIGGKE